MVNKGNTASERNIVLTMLLELEKGKKSHLILNETLSEYGYLDKVKRSFITRLFKGCIERQIELDYIINQYSKLKVKKMKPIIRNVLRMAVYQLKYMPSIPQSAACNEAVKLAKKRGFYNLKGFVNGVLRNIIRNMDSIEYPKDELENISVTYSVPLWLVKKLSTQYSLDELKAVFKALYVTPGTFVRCNTSKASVEDIIENLEYNGCSVNKSEYLNEALIISGYDKLENLDVFKSGMITVQNISSMFPVIAADLKKGDLVIDVCAAPGGKSLHAAEKLTVLGGGEVISRDLSKQKVYLINDNNKRCGYKNIKTEVLDATKLDESMVGKADVILVDVPCSGMGVMAKKPDIKYNLDEQGIEELIKLQHKIVKVASKYLKVGGTMVFSTCTINKDENDTQWIVDELPFEKKIVDNRLFKKELFKGNELRMLPTMDGCDGFYVGVFTKIND